MLAGGAAGAAGTASAAPGAAAVAGAATLAGLYRADRDRAEETRVIDGAQRQTYDDELAEEERQAHQLRADKEARNQRLGLVQTSDANAVRDPSPVRRRGVGHFGSFGLFVLRLVTAAIIGVVGYQVLSDIDATAEFLGATLLPEPRLVAWIVGFGLAVLAVLLVIGLAVRVAGLLLAVVAVGSLVFIRWGQFSPFVAIAPAERSAATTEPMTKGFWSLRKSKLGFCSSLTESLRSRWPRPSPSTRRRGRRGGARRRRR